MLAPLPVIETGLYEENYFMQRTDRGYNNYFAPEIRSEIERVLALNLHELGFFDFEAAISTEKRSIDIGCAAGYCVAYLKNRGWTAKGTDISKSCVTHAVSQGLDVSCADYCAEHFEEKFNLITLWATIEHLPDPRAMLKKIADDLLPGGLLFLSTCNVDSLFAKYHGSNWRYYNFPEHIHFFKAGGLRQLLTECGLTVNKTITYGSGFGKPHTPVRHIADRLAKSGIGDMILFSAQRGEK